MILPNHDFQILQSPMVRFIAIIYLYFYSKIKDIIINALSSRTLTELMTSEGKQAVREQILTNVNDILPENDDKGKPLGKVSRSYFDSFMIQRSGDSMVPIV